MKIDIWSFGILLIKLIGKYDFKIRKGQHPKLAKKIHDDIMNKKENNLIHQVEKNLKILAENGFYTKIES